MSTLGNGGSILPLRKFRSSALRDDGMNKNQEWITENFEALVSEYGRKYVALVNEQVIAAALTPKAVLEEARMKGQDEEDVSLLKVPTEEELVCVL
jgi:hypothetical protein